MIKGNYSGFQPVLVIVGPTAVGKSTMAITIAKVLGGEIVSVDSRYLYRGMNIGTAKPSEWELRKVPHYLVDVANPDETWSLAQIQEEANRRIKEILQRKRLPIVVGGTGQYIRAIVEGWSPPAVVPDEKARAVLENWLKEMPYEKRREKLALLDPESAMAIDARNLRRMIRAFEVIFRTGRRFSELRGGQKPPYQFFQIGLILPRDVLYSRVDQRIQEMITRGFLDEVKELLSKGYSPQLPSFSAIGYREMASYLQGEITFDEAVRLMKRKTRILIRRQANWFRLTDPLINWFDAQPGVEAQIIETVQTWLKENNLP